MATSETTTKQAQSKGNENTRRRGEVGGATERREGSQSEPVAHNNNKLHETNSKNNNTRTKVLLKLAAPCSTEGTERNGMEMGQKTIQEAKEQRERLKAD